MLSPHAVTDPELLRQARRLLLRARKRAVSAFMGEYRSAFRGSGLEFDEVREYQYGDDIRSIDWNVTARNGTSHVFVKLFREERKLNLYVLLDVSGSQYFGTPGAHKRDFALELTALLGLSAVGNQDRFGVMAFTNEVELMLRPTSSRKVLLGYLSQLLQLKAAGQGTRLAVALDYFRRVQHRRAVVFVISDFIDQGYEKALAALHRNHEVHLFRLYHPGEYQVAARGIMPVVQAETGATAWVWSWGKRGVTAMLHKLRTLEAQLTTLARRLGYGYLALDVTQDYMPLLERYFLARTSHQRGKA